MMVLANSRVTQSCSSETQYQKRAHIDGKIVTSCRNEKDDKKPTHHPSTTAKAIHLLYLPNVVSPLSS